MTIYSETQGSGPDVVLLHGWGANLHYMKPLATHLENNFTVTNINLPGQGGSDWQAIESIDDMADQILTVVPESAIYIGWSMGGLVAASIAARFPNRVKHFIGIATTPKFVEDGDWPGLPEPGFQAGFNMKTNEEVKAAMQDQINAEFQGLESKEKERQNLLKLNRTLDLDISVCTAGIKILDALDFRPQYSQISCPMDLILGENDAYVLPGSYPLMQTLNPNLNIHIISNAQHMLLSTHAEELYRVLDTIL